MKKTMIISALACMALWATDFSQMSTEELMNMRGSVAPEDRPAFQQEMQKRMQSMTPEERQKYMGPQGQGMGGMGQAPDMNQTMKGMDMNKEGNMPPPPNQNMGMGQGQGMGMGQGMMKRPEFNDLDLNGDGVVPQEEFEQARKKRMTQNAEQGKMMKNAGNAPAFSDIDANGDDNITADEFEKHQAAQMQNKMPPPVQ